jgi:RimJ/RimL family protein N-acetyltransferase
MLKGNLVTLTGTRQADSETFFRWINDPELVRHNAPFAPVHYVGHEAWFRSLADKKTLHFFCIRVGERLIGSCQLFDVHTIHRSAELQIRIGDASTRGKGYGTDAVRTLLRFAEKDAGLHSVWLRVFTDNERAIRCYEKAGMKRTGTLPQYAFIDGRWKDMAVMSVVFHG